MPTTVFLRPDGQIADTSSGMLLEAQMRAKVERLIGSA
jgi:hypothetical protein